jgi:quinol monooxygenase YgiN
MQSFQRRSARRFILIEQWLDRTALDSHCPTERFTRLLPSISQHQRQDCLVTLMDQSET